MTSPPILSRRALRGTSRTEVPFGQLWCTPVAAGLPLIVVCASRPAAMGWLASTLSVQLPALVAVIRVQGAGLPGDGREPAEELQRLDRGISAACAAARHLEADPERLGLVAEGASATTAIHLTALRATASVPISRLALISPVLGDGPDAVVSSAPSTFAATFPPTMLQFARDGAAAGGSTRLASGLSAAGVAVRATDYLAPRDGWATRSRAVKQAQRGADDLVAFFARGFGTQSTFQVIPGWDRH